jgi:hypothetical protein
VNIQIEVNPARVYITQDAKTIITGYGAGGGRWTYESVDGWSIRYSSKTPAEALRQYAEWRVMQANELLTQARFLD